MSSHIFVKLKCLASMGARGNSTSRFYGRSRKLNVSLLWALEETQRLASMGARRIQNRFLIFVIIANCRFYAKIRLNNNSF
ncbi:hypothetical protein G436_4315 [Leptospira interrogans serovar Hardjo str. Norma]|uniref:Uncharacterized protein n=1 Tax=Leptospira interrogans serovar Hardjo str. Norma TaxID=1279460 RepID=A0A0M5LC51_LEPIR|nr:hypothetical protein G436_4315 [Leptospira interrogans serovar Hardjo str. Norma]OOB95748.1 hypothetical protein B0191_06440 [Leptospira interrogans serovar Hardjo]QEI01508.1 hypothetical protein FWJ33_20460 [Leptospira interrogans serovar Hardjo]